jgi:glyoxylase-like metal-dependent hydrolase (beta-lactamase superfamily II)
MTTALPFVRDIQVEYGVADTVSPSIRRVVAKNPSAFTFKGTGTYIVGRGKVAVIDPGPLLSEHVEALQRAIAGETVTHILITHTHADHSPAAEPFRRATAAKTYGFGPHGSGRAVVREGDFGGGPFEEGGDRAFVPDIAMREGDTATGPGWHLTALHTPGHTSNHLCFALEEERALFTGDHVMGWSTTAIGPPDGDMAAYRASLARLLPGDYASFWPTHGPPVRETAKLVGAYLLHREEREALILKAIADGAATIPEMVARVYIGLDPRLVGAAGRSTFAHLIELYDRDAVLSDGPLGPAARYRLKG